MPTHPNQTQAIQNLQRYLRQLSYHYPSIPPAPIDGIFESDTERALRAFQALRALPITGIADRKTWEELYDLYRASVYEHTPAREVAVLPFAAEEIGLKLGDRGFAVTVLQHMLRELSESHSELEEVEISGVFDSPTQTSVQAFQKKNHIPANGEVDLVTWNMLTDQYNTLFQIQPLI